MDNGWNVVPRTPRFRMMTLSRTITALIVWLANVRAGDALSRISTLLRCRQLFGEWQVRYSDYPGFPTTKSASIGVVPETGMNRVLIRVQPGGHFQAVYRYSDGLFLNEISQRGMYEIRSRRGSHVDLSIRFDQIREEMVSFGGIAIDNVRPVLRHEQPELTFHAEAELLQNDLFLVAHHENESALFYYHLSRSTTLHQPTVQMPLSHLIFSNMLSMFLSLCVSYGVHVIMEAIRASSDAI